MKKYGIAFLFYALLLCAAYYGSFRLSYRYAGEQTKEQMENAGEAVLADTTEKAILKADTEYVVENYNRRTGVTREVRERRPTALLGLDREETLAYAQEYTKEPGIEELENGFEQMDLVSFSDAKVVFRKTYFPWEKAYKYALGEADGLVVVYYMDQKTVYEYTDIPVVSLPERMKRSIRDGNCLLDVPELYDFLENYSS